MVLNRSDRNNTLITTHYKPQFTSTSTNSLFAHLDNYLPQILISICTYLHLQCILFMARCINRFSINCQLVFNLCLFTILFNSHCFLFFIYFTHNSAITVSLLILPTYIQQLEYKITLAYAGNDPRINPWVKSHSITHSHSPRHFHMHRNAQSYPQSY